MLLIAWMVTEGGSKFFPVAGVLEGFYDAQAASLLHGRIDVPPEALGAEAFVHDGKSYGYFGPTPALARLPLNVLIPGLARHWNRLSMLLASALLICMLLLLLRRLEELLPLNQGGQLRNLLGAALIVAVAVGSPNFPLAAEAKAYQEAIGWASALSLASAVCVISYLMRPSRKWLLLSCSTAFFAFFARVSSGVGPVFVLFLLDMALLIPVPRLRRFFAVSDLPSPRQAIVAFSVTIASTVVLWGGLNYWKYGMFFASVPVKMYVSYRPGPESPENLFSPVNVPATVWAYTSPSNIHFRNQFPWVDFTRPERSTVAAQFPHSQVGRVEPFASLSGAMPELLLAALAGTVLCLGRRRELASVRAPLIGALAGCGLIFTLGMITYRYLHDTLPWLALGSAIAVSCIPSIASKRARYAVASLFLLGAAYSTCVNFWFGVLQDRYYAVPTPTEKRLAFLDFGSDIDGAGLWRGLEVELTHWRGYIPAQALQGGNLVADARFSNRPDELVAHSSGPAPHAGEYAIDLPAEGTYHLSIRYASPDSRPVHLFLNNTEVNQACAQPTGGSSAQFQKWSPVGLFHLPGGRLRVALGSNGDFPYITSFRFVRVN